MGLGGLRQEGAVPRSPVGARAEALLGLDATGAFAGEAAEPRHLSHV